MNPKSHYPESATATRSLCGLYDAAGDSDPRLVDHDATCLSCQRIQSIYTARTSTEVSGVEEAGPVVKAPRVPRIVELLLLAAVAILVVALTAALLRRVSQRRRASHRQFVSAAASAGLARVGTRRSSRPASANPPWR